MIMVNLADLVNDKQKVGYDMSYLLKIFCEKYQINPADVEVKLSYPYNVWLSVKV